MKHLAVCILGFLLGTSNAYALDEGDLVAAIDEVLLHHPMEMTGFEWHGIPVDEIDRRVSATYHELGLRPLWVTPDGPGEKAQLVLAALSGSVDEGLDPEDYEVAAIRARWDGRSAEDLATLDVLLSVGFVDYVSDLRHGRVQPKNAEDAIYYHSADQSLDPVAIITEGLESPDLNAFLEDLLPHHAAYRATRDALGRYRQLAEAATDARVASGAVIHPGESDARLGSIRQRLAETGDMNQGETGSDSYDDATVEAVRRFQARHGLGIDGIIGENTLTELNVPLSARVRQIKLNLERWRWMAHELGERYVLVDIPAYTALTVVNDEVIFRMPVIVGKYHHETPVFSDTIKYIVVNPYWTLTPSIARNESLPKLRKNPQYLADKHIKLFRGWSDNKEIDPATIDWANTSRKEMNQYRLRQEPGPWNALGRLKIIFPNDYSVYMHDTPNHTLFDRSKRTFSHGCIRMDEPLKQAALVLGGIENGWSEARIQEIVETGERTVITLDDAVSVHLTYQTAWSDQDGTVHFARDIYGRDTRLAEALYGKTPGG